MVGVAVAMIGLMVITGVLVNAKNQQQTTGGGADAQTSGAIASSIIERDLRMAGYAVNFIDLLGCEVYGYDEVVSPARNFAFTVMPAGVSSGTANDYGTPDNLSITYGTSDVGFSAPQLTTNYQGSDATHFSDAYKVNNRFGFHPGDIVVAVEAADSYSPNAGTSAPQAGANTLYDCVLAEVSGVPSASGQTDQIAHLRGTYTNALGETATARYNQPSGSRLGINFTTAAKIYNLGSTPVNVTYAVNSTNQLTRLSTLTDSSAVPIAENIVMLRARYGKDTNNDGSIDTWDQTTPTTPALWQQVVAIHFAVVARSHKRESTMVSTNSLTLWPAITMASSAVIAGPSMALTDEQRHYRYKVFHSLVPLRNMIWGTS